MDFKTYIDGALRTESTLEPLMKHVEDRGLSNRAFHALLGLQTEMNEILDAIDGKLFEDWDKINILEEIGDASWYAAILADEWNVREAGDNILTEMSKSLLKIKKDSTNFHGALYEISTLRTTIAKMLDHCKKVMFYGKEADLHMLGENFCEVLFCIHSISYSIRPKQDTLSQVFTVNLAKLKKRYPDKFDGFKAEIRDLDSERAILEQLK